MKCQIRWAALTPTVSYWAAWVGCGLCPERNFFPVLLPRPEAMAQWVPGVFLDTLRGKELTSNQGSSKRPEDDLFSHILLPLETPTLS